ncbi:hypothetical protein [Myxococcus virescens]|uniref:Uncharacterized protein n=2 Tax=Myxococcus virescens TaxID=83456 RepID=A0ABY0MH68_9BACT|nr:hypothetical protein [Myxococcus virescens]SDD38680.1 hypothetical protein SAMN04488504_101682 [Myxococcus virescens]
MMICRRFGNVTLEDERRQAVTLGRPDSVEALESMMTPALLLKGALHEVSEQGRARKSSQARSAAT